MAIRGISGGGFPPHREESVTLDKLARTNNDKIRLFLEDLKKTNPVRYEEVIKEGLINYLTLKKMGLPLDGKVKLAPNREGENGLFKNAPVGPMVEEKLAGHGERRLNLME